MAQPKPIIIVDQLVKTYGDKNVVDGVSFEVKKGEIFGILGPNAGSPGWGAAKTAFPDGVWAVVSSKDEQSTAESLAKAAGVTILGWAVPTPEALAAIKG